MASYWWFPAPYGGRYRFKGPKVVGCWEESQKLQNGEIVKKEEEVDGEEWQTLIKTKL